MLRLDTSWGEKKEGADLSVWAEANTKEGEVKREKFPRRAWSGRKSFNQVKAL